MLPKETHSSDQLRSRVTSALRTVARFLFHTLGVRFLLALVSAFALWWYVVPDGSTGNSPGLATGSYRSVAVVAQLRGNPADGYGVTSVQVSPPTVTIQGTVPGLGDANSVNTQPIDITGASSTLTRAIGLDLPLGVSSTTVSTVTVSIYIAPLQGKVSTTAPVVLENLPTHLTATTSPTTVLVTLKGPLPRLNTVEIHPFVDVSGLVAGSYLLPVQVTEPADIGVQITPADVTVTLAPIG
ncbi:MAG TPA: CdaR family protein [Ktedonobacterales bacterium]|nr:CdaR family protein [Ktedonobacterales bacterium]